MEREVGGTWLSTDQVAGTSHAIVAGVLGKAVGGRDYLVEIIYQQEVKYKDETWTEMDLDIVNVKFLFDITSNDLVFFLDWSIFFQAQAKVRLLLWQLWCPATPSTTGVATPCCSRATRSSSCRRSSGSNTQPFAFNLKVSRNLL